MTRLRLAAAGIVPFLATTPLLYRGGAHDGDIPVFRDYGDLVVSGHVPYRDFHIEYPPGAVPIFALPSLGPERLYLVLFQLLASLGILIGLALLALLVERLHPAPLLGYGAMVFAAISPALLGPFSIRRFDMWPAAICIGVLVLLLAERPLWALGLLAVGTLVKSYPVALLPVALLATPRRLRARALGVFCAVGLAVLVPFAAIAHVGLYLSYTQQTNRHLHIDTIGSSILLALHRPLRVAFDGGGWSVFGGGAGAVTDVQNLAQVLGVLAAAYLFYRSRRDPWALAAAAATALAFAATAGKVLTPQFLLWVAPVVLLSRSVVATVLLGAAMLVTNFLFPARYAGLLARHDPQIWMLLGRNVLLVGVLAALCWRQARAVRLEGAP